MNFSYVGSSCRDSPQYRGTGYFFVSQYNLNFTFWQQNVLSGNMPVANNRGRSSCEITARRHVDFAVTLYRDMPVCEYK